MKHFDDSIKQWLPQSHPWRQLIHYFPTIDSTNTQAKLLARNGAPEGTVVIADHQSQGRGRMGRSFYSPSNSGLYLSVVLRPNCTPDKLMHLTCAVGVAVCDAIQKSCDIRPGIKWINDLVWNHKKLGGILVEMAVAPQTGLVDFAIVGIGINCTQQTGDFPPELRDIATSLSLITDQPLRRSHLAAALIDALSATAANLIQDKELTMKQYRSDCVTLGQAVAVHGFDQVRHGTALDVDAQGGLLVQFPNGHIETVAAGEVSIRGMYGYV